MGEVDGSVPADDLGAVRRQRAHVALEEVGEPFGTDVVDRVGEWHDQRWLGNDPSPAVDQVGQLLESADAVLSRGLVDRLAVALAKLLVLVEQCLDIDPEVADIQGTGGQRGGEYPSIAGDGGLRRRTDLLALELVAPAGDGDAGDEPLEVPLEWPRRRLVEVVDIEDEAAVGSVEQTEVRQVGITAQLDPEIRRRGSGEV